MPNNDWKIYQGSKTLADLPPPPPWRDLSKETKKDRGKKFKPSEHEIELVNAALYLRRPLLITGKPGVGKTSLAYSVAHELGLGEVLRWSITTQTKLQDSLYSYDAIGRLQDTSLLKKGCNEPPDISKYLRLGALGTAFASENLRVLLIDEIDKSDIDLPNNLLHIFEEGEFIIPELERLKQETQSIFTHDSTSDNEQKVEIKRGRILCNNQFPLVIMTSNGEREFPPAFLRRCLQLNMLPPDETKLAEIVALHLGELPEYETTIDSLIKEFIKRRDTENKQLATDQLLNAVYLALKDINPSDNLKDTLLKSLSEMDD
ncbi:MAG: MoxR family ATPase [Thiotrichaceae bacterium]|nr:MoxR family ATPase [Thiotrichaceae bacterium]